jgi:hypothetical protein
VNDLKGRFNRTHSGEEFLSESARVFTEDLVPTGTRGKIEFAQRGIQIRADLEEAGLRSNGMPASIRSDGVSNPASCAERAQRQASGPLRHSRHKFASSRRVPGGSPWRGSAVIDGA